MTTAHRPTWKSAVAGGGGDYGNWSTGGQVSAQFSARDLPSQLTLKERKAGQSRPEEVAKSSLRAKLEARERQYRAEKERKAAGLAPLPEGETPLALEAEAPARPLARKPLLLLQDEDELELEKVQHYDDADGEGGVGGEDDSDLGSSDDDSDDSEDDDAELQRELEKIRRERADAKARAEEEAQQVAADAAAAAPQFASATDNPLKGGATMKRRWNDDVVFRNQAATEPEQKKKRFINDTIRNDFHRRFMRKFVR